MKTVKLYKNTVEIEFDEEKHVFKKDGESLISVTGATGMIDKSRALIPWAVGLAKNFLIEKINVGEAITIDIVIDACRQHSQVKERERNVGELAHDWAEQWIKKQDPELPEDDRVRNCVISFLKWVKDTKIKFSSSERIVYSKKEDYVGILDADGRIGDDLVIVDFKATNAIYPEYRYQLAGYWNAAEQDSVRKYNRGYIVQFGKETGEFKALEITQKEYKKDLKAFLGALAIKRREKEIQNGTRQ